MKEILKKLYEKGAAIKFDSVEELINFHKENVNKGFYLSQSKVDLTKLMVFKNFKEYCFSHAMYNVKGIEHINKTINYKNLRKEVEKWESLPD